MSSNLLVPSARAAAQELPPPKDLRDRDQRLQAMKALVGNLAHGFNNALAPLAGYITLMADEVKPGMPGQQYLAKVEHSLRKSDALMSSILQATHPERQFAPKQADLNTLLQRTTEAWLKALPAGAQFSVGWNVTNCSVWFDENHWTRAIQHLLGNAEFALGMAGVLEISLQPRDLTAVEAERLGIAERNTVELRVADSGSGMTEDVLQRACDPLFTTHPGGGTKGLGLTFVHSMVQLHGGQLVLESGPDAGTVVRVWLPRM